MRLITVSEQKNLNAIVRDYYAIPAKASQVERAAAQAIIEANPHLAGLTRIPAGTPILVPDVAETPPKPVGDATSGPLQGLLQELTEALAYAKATFEDSRDLEVQEARDTLATLRSREFKAVASEDVSIQSLTALANNRIKAAEDRAKSRLKGIDEVRGRLTEFSRVISGGEI